MKVETKKPKSKDKTARKCRACSLDCEITRSETLKGLVTYQDKKERSIAVFGSEKPMYTVDKCPKK